MSETQNFTKEVRKVLKLTQPKLRLNSKAVKLVAHCIQQVNNALIASCQSRSGDGMRISTASEAVAELFQGEMRSQAAAEGNRALMKYNTGLLDYEPELVIKAVLAKANLKARKTFVKKFSKGVLNLASAVVPEVSMQTIAKEMLCIMLGALAKKIAQTAKNSAHQSKIVMVKDIEASIDILPNQIRSHARAEGAKLVMFFQSGVLPFEPAKKKLRKDVATRVKKTKVITRGKPSKRN